MQIYALCVSSVVCVQILPHPVGNRPMLCVTRRLEGCCCLWCCVHCHALHQATLDDAHACRACAGAWVVALCHMVLALVHARTT
jgi:hypothetical protein